MTRSCSRRSAHRRLDITSTTDTKTGQTIELDALLTILDRRAPERSVQFYRQWRERFRNVDRSSLSKEQEADLQLIADQIGFSLLELEKDPELSPRSYNLR